MNQQVDSVDVFYSAERGTMNTMPDLLWSVHLTSRVDGHTGHPFTVGLQLLDQFLLEQVVDSHIALSLQTQSVTTASLLMNSLCALVVAWLNASQKSQMVTD